MIIASKQKRALSARHKKALDFAINYLRNSSIAPFVNAVYLYGSCARGLAKWDSDVDIFLELNYQALTSEQLMQEIRLLKGSLSGIDLSAPEVDLKYVFGDEWRTNNMLYYQKVRKEGLNVWH